MRADWGKMLYIGLLKLGEMKVKDFEREKADLEGSSQWKSIQIYLLYMHWNPW